MEFKSLGLGDDLLSAVNELGFVEPTPIQQQAIPHLLSDPSDLIGLASTGTGKTAAFGLPLLYYADTDIKTVQGLVICPTRELCIQISKDLASYGKNMKGLSVVSVYGGADINKQIKQIKNGAQIVVATPGRLLDLIKRKKVNLKEIDTVILDEADEMLNMGFKEDIDQILAQTPSDKCVWLFSATMPKEVSKIAQNYMVDPFEITVGGKNETNKNIEHQVYIVNERDRFAAMKRLIDFNPEIYGLIFCRTRRDTATVADKLMAQGYAAAPLHGDLSQAQRDSVMKKFRDKHIQILVATDVAARGIDVDDITHVIHHKLPEDVENYTHRSGRTARAGKKGVSIALANTREGGKIKRIEKIIKTQFERKNLPSPDQIFENQLVTFIEDLNDIKIDEKTIEPHMPAIMEKVKDLSREDLLKKVVSAELKRLTKYYSNAHKIDADLSSKGGRDKFNRDDENKDRFFVNLGKRDGLNHGALLRIICDETNMNKNDVGKIDILNNFSFFDADKSQTDLIVKSIQDVTFEGKKMSVELTKSKGGGGSRGGGKEGGNRRGKFGSRDRKRNKRYKN